MVEKRFEIFDERLHREALHLLDLESDLRRAIQRSEFEPHFQPIVRLHDGHVVGYEALLRWRHPQRGLLLPQDFLRVAEEKRQHRADRLADVREDLPRNPHARQRP
jgi:predicted signal transduction protein with EAL and GGDEF domain